MGIHKPAEPRTPWFSAGRLLVALLVHTVFPVRFHHRERLDTPDAPFIVFANHSSLMDPPVIGYACRRYEIRFLGKKELTSNPLVRYVLQKIHMIAVERSASDIAAFRASSRVLKEGHVLGIFPEGMRRKPEELMTHIETGLGLLALRHAVPLLPVYIHGKIRAFRVTHVYVGEAISVETLRAAGGAPHSLDALITGTILSMKALAGKA